MTSKAPQAHSQPSRKGKRAWRKNIDLDQVTSGLEHARDEAILTGGQLFADIPPETLFQTDLAGSADIQKHIQQYPNLLKADQIIAARSKVPSVASKKGTSSDRVLDSLQDEAGTKRKRGGGISHKELERLKAIAYGPPQTLEIQESPVTHDPWTTYSEEAQPRALSYLEPQRNVREPTTLRSAPKSHTASGKMIANVPRPNPGRSYNPHVTEWAALLEREGRKEIAAEKARLQAAEEEQAHADLAAAAALEVERQERDQQTFGFSDYESDWEGIQSDAEETQLKARRPTRKTPAERNRIKRRKAAEGLAKHEERMRLRDTQIKRIDALRLIVDAKERALIAAKQTSWEGFEPEMLSSEGEEANQPLRRRRRGKFAVPEAPLELVLPDELQDSLRLLKPEGNVLKDRFRNMIIQGKLESRRAVGQSKKPKRKATEKWSYKDWKLPKTV